MGKNEFGPRPQNQIMPYLWDEPTPCHFCRGINLLLSPNGVTTEFKTIINVCLNVFISYYSYLPLECLKQGQTTCIKFLVENTKGNRLTGILLTVLIYTNNSFETLIIGRLKGVRLYFLVWNFITKAPVTLLSFCRVSEGHGWSINIWLISSMNFNDRPALKKGTGNLTHKQGRSGWRRQKFLSKHVCYIENRH